MTTSATSARLLRLDPNSVTATRAPTRLALTEAERQAVTAMTSGDAAPVLRHVEERSAALATGDSAVRRRCLAKASAMQETIAQQLSALLVTAVARRDENAVILLDRALNSAAVRYRQLMEQLRVESVAVRKVSVMAKGLVAISAEDPT